MVLVLANLPGLSSAQQVDAETGNLVYTTVNPAPTSSAGSYTWTGFNTTTSTGGGTSGGNAPAYNTSTGVFMFGYTQGTINYSLAVNTALQAAGSGIQVNGFRYSWYYINQDFTSGILNANFSLTNTQGTVVENYSFNNIPKTTEGWTQVTGIQNFNTQYSASNLNNLLVTFSGKDDRFWAGYYGPQVKDIDVRLLYSAGSQPPTDSNPACTAYSTLPKCVVQTATTSSTSITLVPTSNDVLPISSQPPPPPIEDSTKLVNTPPLHNPVQANALPPAHNTQRVGEITDSARSLQLTTTQQPILNILANEQAKIRNIERSAVQQATEQVNRELESTQKLAEKTASDSQIYSIAASLNLQLQNTATNIQIQPLQQSNNFFSQNIATGTNYFSQQNNKQTTNSQVDANLNLINFNQAPQQFNTAVSQVTDNNLLIVTNSAKTQLTNQLELPNSESTRVGAVSLIEEISKPLTVTTTDKPLAELDTNKKAIANNELAGQTDIATLASQPPGFSVYTSLVLSDNTFYAPREIYRNQKTVDNTRALRQLTGSKLYQQMIDQQGR